MAAIRELDAGTAVKTGMFEEIAQCLKTVEIVLHRNRETNMWPSRGAEMSRVYKAPF